MILVRIDGAASSRERSDGDFFEEDDVVVAVILQADVAFVGAAAVLRFEIEFAIGHGAAFGVVGDADAVDLDDGARAVERDDHRVPLGAGLAGRGQRLGERIERAGDVILVFLRIFGLIVDLDFVAVVDGHPGLARLDGNADEDAGVVVVVAHFVDDLDAAVAEFFFRPVEQTHAAVRADQAVFDGVFAGADVLPAVEIFAVEERAPVFVAALALDWL